MKRTEATGSIDNLYVDRNTELGREGTLLTAEDRNAIQEELVGVIEASGQILDGGDLGQLLKAITLKLGNIAETITGVKTFTDIPVLPAVNPTTANQATRKGYVDGLDSANVKLTGNQTIAGTKTFSSTVVMPSINTGLGVTEVYLMNQNLRSTDSPTFANATIGGHNVDSELDTLNSRVNQSLTTSSSPTFASINTGYGAFEIGQNLRKTDNVSFANLNPPVDNTDSSLPSIGKGGFTYGTFARNGIVTLPTGGTYITIGLGGGAGVSTLIGRFSGGTAIESYAGAAGSIFVWRIA